MFYQCFRLMLLQYEINYIIISLPWIYVLSIYFENITYVENVRNIYVRTYVFTYLRIYVFT